MLLRQDKRFAATVYSGAVAGLDGFGAVAAAQAEMLLLDRQIGAGRAADEVNRVRRGPGLVQVIDAPDEATLQVAPGAEVLDVKVADGENRGNGSKVLAEMRPELQPAGKS